MINLKDMNIDELCTQAGNIRNRIIEVVSKNGGHLSSNLGSVELIIAMHYVFDCKKHPFIFDVSHQAYAHKLITDRWDSFDTLRQTNGISGFTKPSESSSDYFIAGHSSTSLSLGVGVARAIRLNNEDRVPIVLIGDGAMSSGLAYEALDEIGDIKYPMIIILNDNEMSISKPIGAISKCLSSTTATKFYQEIKGGIKKILQNLPDSATYMAKRFEESFKLITPGILFEELGLSYIGPIDGHNIGELINIFQKAKNFNSPVLIHTQTTKGYGYKIAEGKYEKWHSVPPFCIDTGIPLNPTKASSPTKIFANKLLELAKKDEKIVGVTAAMPSGTGLDLLIDSFPNRFFDVAIAEAHATTSMAAMAKEGYKPFVVIYSTFLQRAFDSIIHDVSIMNMPVKFAIDRAGIVGEDGETHQGAFDISYLNLIPNMVIYAPRDDESLELALEFATNYNDSPLAFRYPRGEFLLPNKTYHNKEFQLGKAEILNKGSDIAFLGFGNGVGRAYLVNEALKNKATLVDLRFAKPLDIDLIKEVAKTHKKLYIFSDGARLGGIAQNISYMLLEDSIFTKIRSFEFQDCFIQHGKTKEIEKILNLDTTSILNIIEEDLKNL